MSKYIFKRIYLSGNVKFQIEVPNYANIYIYIYIYIYICITDLKNSTGVDTWNLPKTLI